MRRALERYAEQGAMTIDQLAAVLQRTPDWVRRHSSGERAFLPRLPGKPIRFDPMRLIEILCDDAKVERPCSLTTERYKTSEKSNGGYRKCLV
jgi:hypothetical protein